MRIQPRIVLQYFSDLHLERCARLPRIVQTGDYLILAGDIGHPQTDIYHEFLAQCSARYARVFLVYGNHEWDRGDPTPFRKQLPENVHLLENDTFTLVENRLSILGCTLWTPFTRKETNFQSTRFLERELHKRQSPEHQVICVTHHLPSFQLIAAQYQRFPLRTQRRFANQLDTLMFPLWAPAYWVCGHSHSIVAKKIGRTQCRINTYGQRYESAITIPL